MAKDTDEMTDQEIRNRIIRLGFCADEKLMESFREKIQAGLPPNTGVALRGSVVTNERYEDQSEFDADGPGTSDLDVTLIGDEVIKKWNDDAVPQLFSQNLIECKVIDQEPARNASDHFPLLSRLNIPGDRGLSSAIC
ncbi:hypothetical protein L0152_18105 [bacterium]|nr:hypothetical protein [bacterium]